MKIDNILVPIDFSSCSKNALKIAIDLAKKFEAKIHMINAVHIHQPHPDFMGGSLVDSIMVDYENQVKESFKELESEMIELADVPHESEQFISYLTDAIFLESEQKNIDLIVMGTRANHDRLEHLIGTRATDIIETSSVPVLVIPETVTTFNPKNIGFASDRKEVRNHHKMHLIEKIAQSYDASILAFSIVGNPNDLTRDESHHLREINDIFKDVDCSTRTVESNSITKGIKDFANAHSLDMLAMVPRQHSFFERLFKSSITKNIAIDIDIPLLTFHE